MDIAIDIKTRLEPRSKHGARSMNGFHHSNLVSPTPQARDLASRHTQARATPSTIRPEPFPPGMLARRAELVVYAKVLCIPYTLTQIQDLSVIPKPRMQ